jgi:hypothetical protein
VRRLQRRGGGAGGAKLEEEDLILRVVPSSYLIGGRVEAPIYASDYHSRRFVAKVFDPKQPMVTLAHPFPASWTTGIPDPDPVDVLAEGITHASLTPSEFPVLSYPHSPTICTDVVAQESELAPVIVSADLLPPPPLTTFIPDSGYKPLKETIVNGMRTVLSTFFLREKVCSSIVFLFAVSCVNY